MEIPKMAHEIFSFHNCAFVFRYTFSYQVEQPCPLDTCYSENV